MQKKIFACLLAAILLLNLPTASINAAEGGFTDIGNHWAKELIMKFTEHETIMGYPDGSFHPDGYLLRAEAVTLLNRFFNIAEGGYPTFTDVLPEDWFYFQVGAAEEKGYISGYPNNTFRAGNNVTRLEAFIMIYRLLGEPEHESIYALNRFIDSHTIPSDKPIYQEIVAYMADRDIINAYPDGSLRVNEFITRAEMLSLLNKVNDMITNSNYLVQENEASPSLIPGESATPKHEESITPMPRSEESITPMPGSISQSPDIEPEKPQHATNSNNWPAPLPPGSIWRTTIGALQTTGSGELMSPSSEKRSGLSLFEGRLADSEPYNDTDTVKSEEGMIPADLFTLVNGSIEINENSIIISGSDKAYLNRQYTLPKGTVLELPDSTLILKADLNITDENELIGNRGSAIIEDGGILNFGSGSIIQGLKSSIVRGFKLQDTYYYDVKNSKWKPLK